MGVGLDENYDYVHFTNTFYYPLQNGIYIGLENNHRMDYETEKGFTFHLDISQSDSIYQIKQKIENKTNILVNQQKLSYNDVDLNDDYKKLITYDEEHNNKMLNYGGKDIVKISFERGPNINIFIMIEGKKEEISINPLDTIGNLYELVEKKIGRIIKLEKNILKYEDKYIFIKKELIFSYNFMKNNVVLELIKNLFYIFVRNLGGELLSIFCNQNYKIIQVKELLQSIVDIPVEEMRLIFSGKELWDDKTLYEYQVHNESTLHLVFR